MSAFDLHWPTIWSHLTLLGVAYLLALPIGWDREHHARSAGLRTFPLVATATCGFVLLGIEAFGPGADQLARIIAGVVTGIGFIGGGSILKSHDRVSGTATAASLWSTGAIGVSVAIGRLEIAIALSLVTFVTLFVMAKVKPLVVDDCDQEKG